MDHFAGMCVPLPEDGGEADVDSGEEVADSDAGAAERESGIESLDDGGDSTPCVPQTEVCGNKLDDDCDGETDEASERPEECNGLDDNCDGVVDEGVMTRHSRTDIWPQSIERQNFSQVALLPRDGGGGWLFYRAGDATRVDDTPRIVSIVDLQEHGERAGTASEAQARTAGTTQFVADGDGRWLVVASRQISTDRSQPGPQNVRVQLLKANDLGLVGEYNAGGTDEAFTQTKLLGLDLTTWKGRWWLAGANTDGALTLLELRFGATLTTTPWKILDVDGPNPGDLVQLGDSRSLLAGGLTALLPLRDRLLISAGNGRSGNLTDLLRSRQTTLDQAAAVTYSIGCP